MAKAESYKDKIDRANQNMDLLIQDIVQFTLEELHRKSSSSEILNSFITLCHSDSTYWKHHYTIKNKSYAFYENTVMDERAVCRDFANDFLFQELDKYRSNKDYDSLLASIVTRLATGLILRTKYYVEERRLEDISLPVFDSYLRYATSREGFTNLRSDYSIIEISVLDFYDLDGKEDRNAYLEFYANKIINFLYNVNVQLNIDYEENARRILLDALNEIY